MVEGKTPSESIENIDGLDETGELALSVFFRSIVLRDVPFHLLFPRNPLWKCLVNLPKLVDFKDLFVIMKIPSNIKNENSTKSGLSKWRLQRAYMFIYLSCQCVGVSSCLTYPIVFLPIYLTWPTRLASPPLVLHAYVYLVTE